MSKIIVLGAGMVGSAMALDLAKMHEVTSADLNTDSLAKIRARDERIHTVEVDVTKENELESLIQPYDLVICAVPGFLGYETLGKIIRAGKNVVDISFFPEDALALNQLASENGVTAIVDCGVAPGMDNLILGYWNARMQVTDFECLVGGLPRVRKWPFEYKAPFSPVDVIEEYTRPARYVENGIMVTRSALSDIEVIEFDGLGSLEAFNSDGLRSIMFTMSHIPNMKEKTLRYPGHADKIRVLRDSGFFSEKPLLINGVEIKPIDFSSKLLFSEWKLGEEERELTVMRITINGKDKNGTDKKVIYNLFDNYNVDTKTSSMARTTGYTACAAANMFLDGLFTEKGVFPPELIGYDDDIYKYIINYLEQRDIIYNVEVIS